MRRPYACRAHDGLVHHYILDWGLWCRKLNYNYSYTTADTPITCLWCMWLEHRARRRGGYAHTP